ncbi:hypothetical protein [Kitasatospora sp. NPDC088779]|uniref:hypothetical protein n=1 Tax=Kitasatospora sp. NPDC088779 TaxID=3154964 RepID=UPI00344403AC
MSARTRRDSVWGVAVPDTVGGFDSTWGFDVDSSWGGIDTADSGWNYDRSKPKA